MGRVPKALPEPRKPAVSKPHKCTWAKCDKAYTEAGSLKRHINSAHRGITHTCPDCGKKFTESSSLANHTKSAHQGKTWPCLFDDCDKEFTSFSGRYQHVQTKHAGSIYECVFSDYEKKYTTASGRQKHITSVHNGVRLPYQIDGCTKTYCGTSGLRGHIDSVHRGSRYECVYADCQHIYTATSSRDRHIRVAHQGIQFICNVDSCDRKFSYWQGWNDHVNSEHLGKLLHCPLDECDRAFGSTGGLRYHIDSAHVGLRYPCLAIDCDRIFSVEHNRSSHVKSAHGTPEDAAELHEKKVQIRHALAAKEAQGIFSATKKCQKPAIKGSFCCQLHEMTVDTVAKVLKEKTEEGRLSSSSIQTPDEFALLLQREKVYLDPEVEASLRLLAQGLDDIQIANRSYVMDTEFCWAGEYVAMDITIERLKTGEEIVSTRIDLNMDIEDLQARCNSSRSRAGIRKVCGKSDRT